ncbi:MAG: hypothetical protein ACRCYQ_05740, partial [Nocardioides sp.]
MVETMIVMEGVQADPYLPQWDKEAVRAQVEEFWSAHPEYTPQPRARWSSSLPAGGGPAGGGPAGGGSAGGVGAVMALLGMVQNGPGRNENGRHRNQGGGNGTGRGGSGVQKKVKQKNWAGNFGVKDIPDVESMSVEELWQWNGNLEANLGPLKLSAWLLRATGAAVGLTLFGVGLSFWKEVATNHTRADLARLELAQIAGDSELSKLEVPPGLTEAAAPVALGDFIATEGADDPIGTLRDLEKSSLWSDINEFRESPGLNEERDQIAAARQFLDKQSIALDDQARALDKSTDELQKTQGEVAALNQQVAALAADQLDDSRDLAEQGADAAAR